MKVIKNENGIFVELPREHIKFYGNTEEEKKANELIFDLSLENDRLHQINDELNQINEDLRKRVSDLEKINEQHRETNGELREIIKKFNLYI